MRQTDDTKTKTCSSSVVEECPSSPSTAPRGEKYVGAIRTLSKLWFGNGRRTTKGVQDTLQASCEVPSKRERENPGDKPSVRTTRLGDWGKIAFRTMVPALFTPVKEGSAATPGKTSHPACAVPMSATKRDRKTHSSCSISPSSVLRVASKPRSCQRVL